MSGLVVKQLSIIDMAQELADVLLAERPLDFTDITSGFGERCVYYEPDGIYIHFKPDWTASRYFGFVGIKIDVSDDWDAVLYAPLGNISSIYLPISAHATYNADPIYLDTTDERDYWWAKPMQAIYHSDQYGIQLWWRNPFSFNTEDSRTILFNLEIIPAAAREFSDSESDLFFSAIQYGSTFNASDVAYEVDCMRPFSFVTNTESFKFDTYAYQSSETGDLYIDFPWYYTDPGTYLTPVYRTNRWFVISHQNSNLVPNDVVTWDDGGTVRSFVVLDFSTGTEVAGTYFVAIPYENAKEYI